MKDKKKISHKRDNLKEVEMINNLEKSKNIKTIYEFNPNHSGTIKALAVQRNNTIKPSTRFFSGKMLIFAKILLKSFVYDLVETFMFPNKK